MKKLISFILAAMMILTAAFALADTKIDPQENRGIKPASVTDNVVEEGISPTTGLTLSTLNVPSDFAGLAVTGRYMPMMVQISNADGGIDNLAPWGVNYADIVYEMILNRGGETRMSAIFSDIIPDSVGPVRSARVAHAWVREEWGAGFLFYGQQEMEGSNVLDEFRQMGHKYLTDGYFFSGIVGDGKPWKKYYTRRKDAPQPNNANANVSAMYSLIPEDYVPTNHAFKFTDELPEGDDAQCVRILWSTGKKDEDVVNPVSSSELIYDVDSNTYLRYLIRENDTLVPWVERDTQEQIGFANVIVQFTTVTYNKGDGAAPIVEVIGKTGKGYTAVEGNADFFMGGKHIAGYWKHDSVNSRTVYYGPDGEEISLQRGKTLIILFPNDQKPTSGVVYSATVQ